MVPLTHGISRSTWYLLVVIYVSLFALAFANMWYTNRVAEQNTRKWCNLLVTLDEAYQEHPPQTEAGQRAARDIHQLRTEFDCRTRPVAR